MKSREYNTIRRLFMIRDILIYLRDLPGDDDSKNIIMTKTSKNIQSPKTDYM